MNYAVPNRLYLCRILQNRGWSRPQVPQQLFSGNLSITGGRIFCVNLLARRILDRENFVAAVPVELAFPEWRDGIDRCLGAELKKRGLLTTCAGVEDKDFHP